MEKNRIKELALKYGTPLYVYDGSIIDECLNKLKYALPEKCKIYFSLKCNPLMGICQYMYERGCGVEVASSGELYIALNSGVDPENIIFTSPGKTVEELMYAIENNIKIINIESMEELKLVNSISANYNKNTNVIIRVNPDFGNSSSVVKMTGVSSQFGIDETKLDDDFFKMALDMKNIKICGIQIYMGTQNLDANNIYTNFKSTIGLAKELFKKYNIPLEYIDCGGGFGVKYFANDKVLDVELLKDLNQTLNNDFDLADTQLIFESGRFLLADSGYFVTQIKYIKESKGKKYYICDGGMNCFSSAAFLGRFVRNNFPIMSLSDSTDDEVVNVTGPLCTPTDLLGQNISLAKSKVDDFIVISKAGAYGYTYSPILFLSHNSPKELLVTDREVLLREKGNMEDLIKNQRRLYD